MHYFVLIYHYLQLYFKYITSLLKPYWSILISGTIRWRWATRYAWFGGRKGLLTYSEISVRCHVICRNLNYRQCIRTLYLYIWNCKLLVNSLMSCITNRKYWKLAHNTSRCIVNIFIYCLKHLIECSCEIIR